MNKDFNIACYNFQEEIITKFNEQGIPFLLKYYLFKQIWDSIELKKRQLDFQIQSEKIKDETQTLEIPIIEKKEQIK